MQVKINEQKTNNLRYADDTDVIAGSLPQLQYLVDLIVQHSQRYGLYLNTSKTKLVIFSKSQTTVILKIQDDTIEKLQSIRILNALINQQRNVKVEIRSRIE